MTTASERGWPTSYAHLRYEEPDAAIAWLVRVFGFREVARACRSDQRIIVSELEGPGGGTVMIAELGAEFREYVRERVPESHDLEARPYPILSCAISMKVNDVDPPEAWGAVRR